MKVVVIGGVAAGPKTASRIRRLCDDAEVTIVEKGEFLSYAGCGLPYYISGMVKDQKELMATPVGTVRDSVFFRNVKDVHVMNHTEATAIDRENKRVAIQSIEGKTQELEYDKLVLATGANSFIPPIPGVDLQNIFNLKDIHDADAIKEKLAEHKAINAVIVGGGLIGVEVAEAFHEMGCRITVVEFLPNILPMMDPEMSTLVEGHFESKGVSIKTSTKVTEFTGDGRVEKVITDQGEIPADIVIMAVGVRPATKLAVDAGLKIGPTHAIAVNGKCKPPIPISSPSATAPKSGISSPGKPAMFRLVPPRIKKAVWPPMPSAGLTTRSRACLAAPSAKSSISAWPVPASVNKRRAMQDTMSSPARPPHPTSRTSSPPQSCFS